MVTKIFTSDPVLNSFRTQCDKHSFDKLRCPSRMVNEAWLVGAGVIIQESKGEVSHLHQKLWWVEVISLGSHTRSLILSHLKGEPAQAEGGNKGSCKLLQRSEGRGGGKTKGKAKKEERV